MFSLLLILLTAPLFFYKLGQSSLVSWDEAWYGSIAKNIVQSRDLLNLTWNDAPYLDHPPLGFYLMAGIYSIFGADNLTTRIPSAILGVGSLVLTYLIGRELFTRWLGLLSALALSSAPWFLYRARSGNLDVPLTFFFLLTIYCALQAVRDQKWLWVLGLATTALFLTKTMVPLAVIPVLALIFYRSGVSLRDLLRPGLVFLIIVSGWFGYQSITHSEFLSNLLFIGARGSSLQGDYLANVRLTLDYLHQGVGKWYWLGIGSLLIGLALREKRLLIFILFFGVFLLPFIFSPKGQIWHLIPLHPILIIGFFGVVYILSEQVGGKLRYLLLLPAVILGGYLYLFQIKLIWYQFIEVPAYISDEEILATEAKRYSYQLLTDGDFDPAATFYSEKTVRKIKREELSELFKREERFLLVTNDWRITEAKIPMVSYQILKKDRDKVLILH